MKKFLLLSIFFAVMLAHSQTANVGDIIITEFLTDPSGNEFDREWFEVYNTTNAPIDMNGWRIVDLSSSGDTHIIQGSVVIQPLSYAVFTSNGDSAANGGITNSVYSYGFDSPIGGPPSPTTNVDTPRLNNESTFAGGSTNDDGIGIELPDGTSIDEAAYGYGYNGLPNFPAQGTPEGTAVQLNTNNLDSQSNDLGANWRASVAEYGTEGFFGTPGAANFAFSSGVLAPGDIIITEIMIDPNGTESQTEWFEVYNTTSEAIDMENWVIGDVSSGNSATHLITSSVVVQPQSYALFAASSDPLINRGLPTVDYAYGFNSPATQNNYLRLNNESSFDDGATDDNETDGVFLLSPSDIEIDRVAYDYGYGTDPIGFPERGGDDGASIELGFSYFNLDDNNLATSWSRAVNDYSGDGDFGTPRAANDFNRVYTYDGAWQAPFGDINGNNNPTQDLVVLSGTATITLETHVRNALVDAGATLSTNAGAGIIFTGSPVVDGTLTGASGSGIAFEGITAQTLTGSGLVDVSAFGIDNSAGLTTSVDVEVRDGLTIAAGNLINAGSFTLKDNASGSSRITAVPSGSTVTGNFKVEKYLAAATSSSSSGRAFRFVASPVNSTGTTFDNWQAGGSNVPNQGTHITGAQGTVGNIDTSTGFDETTSGAPSLFNFSNNTVQDWLPVTSTNQSGDDLNVGEGYRLFVRGDRDPSRLSGTVTGNATTLTVQGTVSSGDLDFNYDVDEDQFVLFGNPYPSPIEVESVLANSVNVDPNLIYYWDPNIGGDNGRGGYVLVRGFASGGLDVVQPTSPTSSSVMRSGESAFVIATAGANGAANMTLNFAEADKVAAPVLPSSIVGKTNSNVERIMINLFDTASFENGGTPSDAVSLDFNAGAADADLTNIVKLYNQDESFAIKNGERDLAVQSISTIEDGTTIPLVIYNYGDSNYTFSIDVTDFDGYQVALKDVAATDNIILDNGVNNRFDFAVTTGVTDMTDRFSLVFNKSSLSSSSDEIQGLSLYPNPTHGDKIFVTGLESTMTVQVFNTLGQQMGSILTGDMAVTGLDTSSWTTGVYLVKVTQDEKSKTFKVVRQ